MMQTRSTVTKLDLAIRINNNVDLWSSCSVKTRRKNFVFIMDTLCHEVIRLFELTSIKQSTIDLIYEKFEMGYGCRHLSERVRNDLIGIESWFTKEVDRVRRLKQNVK